MDNLRLRIVDVNINWRLFKYSLNHRENHIEKVKFITASSQERHCYVTHKIFTCKIIY